MATLAPRGTRATRAKHGGNKLSIDERLLAAMERLLEQGLKFGNLSVEQLTTEAGMSRATFYLHFRDKGELVARLMEVVTEDIVRSAGAWLAFPDRPQRADIEAALMGVAGSFRRHRAIIAALNDTAGSDPAVEALYTSMMDTICLRCRHAVSAAMNGGLARPEADNDVADALSWIVVLYFGRFAPIRKGAQFERLARAVTHICATAVFADSPSQGETPPPKRAGKPRR